MTKGVDQLDHQGKECRQTMMFSATFPEELLGQVPVDG